MTVLGDALNSLTDDHKLDPITDNVKVKSQGCKLKSGEESLFVTVFCCEIVRKLEQHELRPPPHEFFYCPSRRTEWKLGFDLSIGYGEPPHRIRTMHKLLTGRLCDQKWSWRCTDEDALHMALLMGAHKVHGVLDPFLVIHTCYCVHDYRRMGAPTPTCVIPSFASPLRTLILDLAALRDGVDEFNTIDWSQFMEAVAKCDEKAEALEVLDEFNVGRLKLIREKPSSDLKEPKPDFKKVLNTDYPKLYYPSSTAVKDPHRFFLTFDDFADRVAGVAAHK